MQFTLCITRATRELDTGEDLCINNAANPASCAASPAETSHPCLHMCTPSDQNPLLPHGTLE